LKTSELWELFWSCIDPGFQEKHEITKETRNRRARRPEIWQWESLGRREEEEEGDWGERGALVILSECQKRIQTDGSAWA
jgi:hypothetical protein